MQNKYCVFDGSVAFIEGVLVLIMKRAECVFLCFITKAIMIY